MNHKYEINEKWIKASILGTIWAASEIVLGSFLHNLRVPFSGNILTAIAIILLISFSYRWKENGLFWRAGLICALMKTISPSAVIFGPMIAIFSESVLIEISIRLFGRTFIGFAIGSMLAMSWNLFQKIANFLISYGFNIVELYSSLIKLAQKQLNIQTDILWMPLIVLLILFALFGLFSAIVGIKTGRKLQQQPIGFEFAQTSNPVSEKRSKQEFTYSLLWLLVNVLLIVTALVLQNFSKPVYWISFITAVVIVWAFRYKRAMRQLSRPGFWIFFVVITMLMAFVFTSIEGKNWQEGLLIGLQMNFRAILVITGFSVLGTELYNPKIRGFFLKTSFKQLPLALELSFESLPTMISQIPDFKTVVKNPVSLVYKVVQQAEVSLGEIRKRLQNLPKVYIISGAVGQGKTSFLLSLSDELRIQNIKVGGFLSLRQMENGETTGYDLLDISTRKKYLFLRPFNEGLSSGKRIGRFSILEEGLLAGKRILENGNGSNFDVLIVDEVGKLELKGGGWADQLKKLLDSTNTPIVLAIRKGFEHEVLAHFQILKYEIIPVGKISSNDCAERISAEKEPHRHIDHIDF